MSDGRLRGPDGYLDPEALRRWAIQTRMKRAPGRPDPDAERFAPDDTHDADCMCSDGSAPEFCTCEDNAP